MSEMRTPLVAALLAALVVAASVAALPVGVGSQESPAETNRTSGEALAGALAAQGSQLEGDLDRRALSAALERADGPEATAELLSERRLAAERRAEALAERRERLRAERDDGNLTASAYRVEQARLAAEADRVRSLLAAIERESRRLPPELRSTYGLDRSALNRSLARTSAVGPDDPLVGGTNTTADPEAVRNATARAVAGVESRQAELSAILAERDDAVAACGQPKLAASTDATDRARSALERGESATAESALVEARTSLRAAARCLEDGGVSIGDEGLNGTEWNESRWEGDWNDTTFDGDYDRSTPTRDGSWDEDDHKTPTKEEYGTPTRDGTYSTETSDDYDSK